MKKLVVSSGLLLTLMGCASHPPMKTVDYVDIERFMGDWYVIANIPTFLEKGAHNAIESYRLNEDGTIATTFTFYDGGFDGGKKFYRPTGFIVDEETNALWGMQFIWPIKADFRIVYLDDEYRVTVIGRQKRDYVWIMAREKTVTEEDWRTILDRLDGQGFDRERVVRVPHSP